MSADTKTILTIKTGPDGVRRATVSGILLTFIPKPADDAESTVAGQALRILGDMTNSCSDYHPALSVAAQRKLPQLLCRNPSDWEVIEELPVPAGGAPAQPEPEFSPNGQWVIFMVDSLVPAPMETPFRFDDQDVAVNYMAKLYFQHNRECFIQRKDHVKGRWVDKLSPKGLKWDRSFPPVWELERQAAEKASEQP